MVLPKLNAEYSGEPVEEVEESGQDGPLPGLNAEYAAREDLTEADLSVSELEDKRHAEAEAKQRQADENVRAEQERQQEQLDEIDELVGDGTPMLDPDLMSQEEAEAAGSGGAGGAGGGPSVTNSGDVGSRDPLADALAIVAEEQRVGAELERTRNAAIQNEMDADVYEEFAQAIAARDARAVEAFDRVVADHENAIRMARDAVEASGRAVVDPAAFFKNQGLAAGFSAAMATGVGHIASALGGGPNAALDTINRAVERNIAAQEFNIGQTNLLAQNRLSLIDKYKGLGFNINQARNLARLSLIQQAEYQIKRNAALTTAANAPADMQILLAGLNKKKAELAQEIAKDQKHNLRVTGKGAIAALRAQRRAESELAARQYAARQAAHQMLGMPQEAAPAPQPTPPSRVGSARSGTRTQRERQMAQPQPGQGPLSNETLQQQEQLAGLPPRARAAVENWAKKKDKASARELRAAALSEVSRAINSQPADKRFTIEQAKAYIAQNPVLRDAQVKPTGIIRPRAADVRNIGGETYVLNSWGQELARKDRVGTGGIQAHDKRIDDLTDTLATSAKAPKLYAAMQKYGFGDLKKLAEAYDNDDPKAVEALENLKIYLFEVQESFRRENGLGVINSPGELKRMQEGSGVPSTLDEIVGFLQSDEGKTYWHVFRTHAVNRTVVAKRQAEKAGLERLADRVPSADSLLRRAEADSL